MQILQVHLANCEGSLLTSWQISTASGSSVNKGAAREAFLKGFLSEHLPTDLAVGTGELIDYLSEDGEQRNQHDIVIYECSFPKIHLGGGVNAFLRESVIATIEVKSTLDADEVLKATKAAVNAKKLQQTGGLPMRPIANYVVAYAGAAKMETVFGWIGESYKELQLSDPDLGAVRHFTPSAALDGVYLLGVGACIFENNVGFSHGYTGLYPKVTWSLVNHPRSALFMVFAGMLGLVQDNNFREINPYAYMRSFTAPNLKFGRISSEGAEIFPEAQQHPTSEAAK